VLGTALAVPDRPDSSVNLQEDVAEDAGVLSRREITSGYLDAISAGSLVVLHVTSMREAAGSVDPHVRADKLAELVDLPEHNGLDARTADAAVVGTTLAPSRQPAVREGVAQREEVRR